jgi:hypothetical protein
VFRLRRPAIIATVAASALLGPLAWNAILRAVRGEQFFTGAPLAVLLAGVAAFLVDVYLY